MKKVSALRRPSVLLFFVTAALLLTGAAWFSASAFATAEQAGSSVTLAGVTLPQNNSYVTDGYFGVIHLESGDTSVACASLDSENRVVITAVGTGSTKITFWYKRTSSEDWTSATLPFTVSGKSDVSTSVTQAGLGIFFPQSTVSLKKGQQDTIGGITENGYSVAANSLLWVTSSDSVLSVDTKTGKITAVGTGTAVLYALDPQTKNVASVTVQVS